MRVQLVLCRARGKPMAALVDRKLVVYRLSLAARSKYFEGSLFDGELVALQDGSHVLLLFDVVALEGSDAPRNQPLLERLDHLRRIFNVEGVQLKSPQDVEAAAAKGKIIASSIGPTIRVKNFLPLHMTATVLRHMDQLPYACDGLILAPLKDCVRTGTSPRVFKLKRHHTVDVEARRESRELWVGAGGDHTTARRRVPLSEVERSAGREVLVAEDFWSALDRCTAAEDTEPIVEARAERTDAGIVLRFERLRNDKCYPNALSTVLRTLRDVAEALTFEELAERADRAWRFG
jgi:hypothetical protein